ncbi:hypothetical protein NQ176_g4084 [Zarea fungicola]|uniref:Uncharacterized protein n=1 Tax=Zarea fungicola TaxID=93591 RepID=A0ACC1NHF1_9HYPO|nr:hypothetical protein NQ176_g4084 [Lecanicillium fungicola]
MAAKIHRFILAAAVLLATPLAALPTKAAFNLANIEAAFHNPGNAALVWVVDSSGSGGFDITHGHLEPIDSTPPLRVPLQNGAAPPMSAKEDAPEVCLTQNPAPASTCKIIIEDLQKNVQSSFHIEPGQVRSICFSDGSGRCCVSWSAKASLDSTKLGDAAAGCLKTCPGDELSCQTRAAATDGQDVNVCVAGRADGCGQTSG